MWGYGCPALFSEDILLTAALFSRLAIFHMLHKRTFNQFHFEFRVRLDPFLFALVHYVGNRTNPS